MTEEAFTQFKKGELDRLSSGFFGISGEADQLYYRLTTFCYDDNGEIEWEKTANEIEAITALTFEDVKKFYKTLFAPSEVPSTQKITLETYKDYKNDASKNQFMSKMTLTDDVRNANQVDEQNYIAFRVFSNKFKDDIQHTSIQKHALLGDRVLVPKLYTVYLPKLHKENAVVADLGDAIGAVVEEEIEKQEIVVAPP